MSTFENIFKIAADGSISLNKEELRGNDIFKKFIGNKKENMQDMMYIYMMGDPRSKVSHLPPAEKQKEVIKAINRDDLWQPAPMLRSAVEEYSRIIALTPTGKSFLASNKALYTIGEDVNSIMDTNNYLKSLLRAKIAVLETDTLGLIETLELVKECKSLLSEILKQDKNVQAIIKDLPSMNKTVKELADAWANEGNGTKAVHGGGEINSREE